MKLKEIQPGQIVIVQIHNKLDMLEYTMKLDYYDEDTDTLKFATLYEDEKVLNFEVKKATTHIDIVVTIKQTFTFKDVTIWNEKIDNTTAYHCCSGDIESAQNMRDSTRHLVHMGCIYKRGEHRGTCSAKIRDISLTGFAVMVEGNVNLGDTPSLDVSFSNNYIVTGNLKIKGQVVRIIGDPEDPTQPKLVGCKVLDDNKAYRGWIMALERERAKLLKGKY
jgi:hypothetical protein